MGKRIVDGESVKEGDNLLNPFIAFMTKNRNGNLFIRIFLNLDTIFIETNGDLLNLKMRISSISEPVTSKGMKKPDRRCVQVKRKLTIETF